MLKLIFGRNMPAREKFSRLRNAKRKVKPAGFLLQYHLGGRTSVMLIVCSVWLMS